MFMEGVGVVEWEDDIPVQISVSFSLPYINLYTHLERMDEQRKQYPHKKKFT